MSNSLPSAGDVGVLAEEYLTKAIEWADLSGTNSSARQANKVFVDLHRLAVSLRTSEAGRKALEVITSHPRVAVRMKAAAECLYWNSQSAVSVLEEIEQDNTNGLYRHTAHYTLLEYSAGRLNLDW
ncbi:hypothetical protein ACFDTO_08505 [Microbacteriaceae bacterium 4G12]